MAEKIITTRDMMEPISVLLRWVDCDPKIKGPLATRLLCYFFIIANAFWTVFLVIKLINNEDSLAVASNTYINYIITTQIPAKAYQLYFHSEELSALLDVFWDDFWPSTRIKSEVSKYNRWHRMILRSIKTYRGILSSCIVFIFGSPLLFPVKTLPLEMWFFGIEEELHKSPCFEVLYFVQSFSSAVPYITCLIPFDMLFIAMVGCANIQFDMLRHEIKKIGDEEIQPEDAFDKLKELIGHHEKILKFINDLELYFTRILLKQYLDAVTCMGVYIYLEQQDFHFVYLFSLMTNMSQTLLYSLCGQIIQDQSCAVADAAYECGWEHIHGQKFNNGLIRIIQRSDRKLKISAGGFIFLSFESFVGMLKAAFSFLAVLRSTSNRTTGETIF